MKTYNIEREDVAENLISFDKIWGKQMSLVGKNNANNANSKIDSRETFVRSSASTVGLTVTYKKSSITRVGQRSKDLAINIIVGMQLPNVQVGRFCDRKSVQQITSLPSDGRWRIWVFPGTSVMTQVSQIATGKLCAI